MTDEYRPLAKNNRGPRSPAAKVAVSRNHITHGMAAAELVLPSEDEAAWLSFHGDVLADLEPEGAVEVGLACRIAELLWRLRRMARAEQQSVAVAQKHRDALAASHKPAVAFAGDDEGRDVAAGGEDPRPVARRNFYADALNVIAVVNRYSETLPVVLPDEQALDSIIRYEAHLSRDLKHTLHELEARQDRRRGNPTPLARLDIS